MSPSRLEEASVEVKRVTLSVVGHNRILQGLADDEATNLGVGPVFNEGWFYSCQHFPAANDV